MKLSKTGWNNVIIFSVMAIIVLINTTNDKLFPQEDSNKAEQLILPQHAVILTLAISYSENENILLERVGRSWQITTTGLKIEKNENQIEQMMFAWQQSRGLVQASEIIIDSDTGLTVNIALAGEEQMRNFILYTLSDQLLVYKQDENIWLALPASFAQQLLPLANQ